MWRKSHIAAERGQRSRRRSPHRGGASARPRYAATAAMAARASVARGAEARPRKAILGRRTPRPKTTKPAGGRACRMPRPGVRRNVRNESLNWQPRMDSNHRMPESESGALPLGDGAVGIAGEARAAIVTPNRRCPKRRGRQREGAEAPTRHRTRREDRGRSRPSQRSDQRFENWVARRALCRPIFLRSTSRASRVMKPALRSSDFSDSSYSTNARAMPRRIAPA